MGALERALLGQLRKPGKPRLVRPGELEHASQNAAHSEEREGPQGSPVGGVLAGSPVAFPPQMPKPQPIDHDVAGLLCLILKCLR